ncbi:MAG: hypothetical protein JWO11_446 [Nocardioides sp.]|nr:hypothetical protein [Nocardioides sp.]
MTSLVSVADTLVPSLLVPGEPSPLRPSVRRRQRSAEGRVWARSRRATLTVAADLAAVAIVTALVAVTEVSVAPVAGLALACVWVTLLMAVHAYDAIGGRRAQASAVLRAGAVLGLACWCLPTVVDPPATSQQLMMVTGALTSLAITNRLTVDAWSTRAIESCGGTPVLVAGDVDAVARAVSELRRVPGRWTVVSACVREAADELQLDVPVTVGVDDIPGVVAATGAQAVLVLPCHWLDPHRLRRLGWQLEASGTRLYVGTGLIDVAPCRTSLGAVGDLSVVDVRAVPSGGLARTLEHAAERVVALAALVVLAPLLVMVALAVRRDSPGPAIFRQRRVGRDGAEFTMFKFRTMTTDAEARVVDLAAHNESAGDLLFKIRQDPRVTRLGAVLRRYSVDELPQLVNVALGDMSLVGPRPALPDEVERYDPDARRRLAVRPGITGLWQVSGRSDLSWEETVRLDLHYVDNWSPALDLQILFRTARAVLGHAGAY